MNDKKRVLLIGVTGGVGEVAGDMLLAAGYEVFATCRGKAKRDELAALGKYHRVLQLDLASRSSVEAAFAELRTAGIQTLDALVNCAAINPATPMEIVSEEETRLVFETDLFSVLRAVQLAIPMLRPTRGRIVLVGSLAGTWVMPMLGVYSAAKFALEGACDALRRELYPWGITTSLVKPGAILTRMFYGHLDDVARVINDPQGDAKLYVPLYRAHAREIPRTQRIAVSTEGVAKDIMHALTARRPKARYFSGWHSQATGIAARLLPDRVHDWAARKIFGLM
jgi:NAD(P)-dependent dehydrogenase (short-subunit alcohol dehydrogenase family)